jgi:hypothetical protein
MNKIERELGLQLGEANAEIRILKGKLEEQRLLLTRFITEIGDDELPVQIKPQQKPGALYRQAFNLCGDDDFWGFAGVSNAGQAKNFILATCQCDSRKDLGTNPVAAAKFETLIRKPFQLYMR